MSDAPRTQAMLNVIFFFLLGRKGLKNVGIDHIQSNKFLCGKW